MILKFTTIFFKEDRCLQTEFLYQPYQHLPPFSDHNRDYPAQESLLEALPQIHQSIIEDLPREEGEKFSTYLQDESKQANFPANNHKGNLLDTLKSKTGLSDQIIRAVFAHTAQDDKKRGVGMGELAMTLLFKNVANTVGGKGDLSINGGEFEVKGNGAKLGPKGRAAFVRRKRRDQKKGGDTKKGGQRSKGKKPVYSKTGA